MKRKIAMIQPYFGRLPNYFDLALKSYAFNADFDWYIFTDDRGLHDYPANVFVTYTTLAQLKTSFQQHFDIPLSLERPYKLCDYKPLYGHLFARDLKGYDFWGHFDPDVIFGDIGHFVSEELYQQYDRLFTKGHFSLYRNTPAVNLLYREKVADCVCYEEVLTSKRNWAFDERVDGVTAFFAARNLKTYTASPIADIYYGDYAMRLNIRDRGEGEKAKKSCYAHEAGGIYRHYWLGDDIHREEFMYIHLQKRAMDVLCTKSATYLIYGNAFRDTVPITRSLLAAANKDKLFYCFVNKRMFVRHLRTSWRMLFVEKAYKKLLGMFLKKGRSMFGLRPKLQP